MIHGRGFEGDPQPDAETEARRASEGYLAAFGYRNETLRDDRTKGRGSFEERLPVGTRTARVDFGYGPRDRTRNARNNVPMKGWKVAGVKRSEEHTSELQSLMRSSYAVFCLKKKPHNSAPHTNISATSTDRTKPQPSPIQSIKT